MGSFGVSQATKLSGLRVWMYTRSLDYLDAFVTMMDHRAVHDYTAAKKAMGTLEAIREEL